MSKQRAKGRPARRQESGLKAAARGAEADRRERQQARKQPAKGRGKTARRAPAGRQTGVLAQRRRQRIRLLVAALVVANIVVWLIWRDWAAQLAALILTAVLAPLLAGILLRRR